ncbi:MAG: hypothetical protein ABR525_06905 [Candidatus Limnocylindria bacterium]
MAAAFAAVAVFHWATAIGADAPVLYGEGAVAHAALLARRGAEYAPSVDPRVFNAANYPPLYLRLAGAGDPFVAGRMVSVGCTLLVAGAIAHRARAAGALVALALAAAFVATAPVALWGPAVKPDLLALALTVAAVVALDRAYCRGTEGIVSGTANKRMRPWAAASRVGAERARAGALSEGLAGPRSSSAGSWRPAAVAGALFALAILAKPTAALPAGALLAWVAVRAGRAAAAGAVVGGVAAATAAALLLPELRPPASAWLHVVSWNALPWSASSAVSLILVAALTTGVAVAVALIRGPARGAVDAYLAAAIGIVLLGGREGATINYILDLAAASLLAIASIAPALRTRPWYPLAAAAQLLVGIAVLNPFGLLPGPPPTTGAWSDPSRVGIIRALPSGTVLIEDSGLAIATGREPTVDDLFLWSQLVKRGSIDPGPLLDATSQGAFVAVVSQADLERLDAAPAFERARWDAALVEAVIARYKLDASTRGLYVYVPR